MEAPETGGRPATLENAWGMYRAYAKRSRQEKPALQNWRLVVLALTVLAGALGTLSSQLGTCEPAWVWRVLGGASAVMVALAVYFTKQVLDSKREHNCVRARSAAEGFKSEAYRFATQTRPYAGPDATQALSETAAALAENVKDIPPADLTEEQRREKMPPYPMSMEQYGKERVQEQIKGYYERRAGEHETAKHRWSIARFALAAIAFGLGGLAGFGVSNITAAWVAVLSAAATAVAAHMSAERHGYLMLSFRTTAGKLRQLVGDWTDKHINDEQFVSGCEDTISIENKTWLAKWTERKKDEGST